MIKYGAVDQARYNAKIKPVLGFKATRIGKRIILDGKVDTRIIQGLLDRGYTIQLKTIGGEV